MAAWLVVRFITADTWLIAMSWILKRGGTGVVWIGQHINSSAARVKIVWLLIQSRFNEPYEST